MRHFDLSPLYRSTVGFDRLFSLLDPGAGFDGPVPTYPPYNIERTSEKGYRVTVAVAGLAEKDLAIEVKENALTIRGEKAKEAAKKGEVLHQGMLLMLERRFRSLTTSGHRRFAENGLRTSIVADSGSQEAARF